MTIKELQDRWIAFAAGRAVGELRVSTEGGLWMARGGGKRMAGADLESAVRGLLQLLEPKAEVAK